MTEQQPKPDPEVEPNAPDWSKIKEPGSDASMDPKKLEQAKESGTAK